MFNRLSQRRKEHKSSLRLVLDRLEDRTVPSVAAFMSNGTLYVSGSPTDPAGQIRIDGSGKGVQVFDNDKFVEAFSGVTNINVTADDNTNFAIDLGSTRDFGDLTVQMGKTGFNNLRVGEGRLASVNIIGGNGSDSVVMDGISASTVSVDLGADKDSFALGKGAIKQLTISNTENVSLTPGTASEVVMRNDSGTATTSKAPASDTAQPQPADTAKPQPADIAKPQPADTAKPRPSDSTTVAPSDTTMNSDATASDVAKS